MTTPLESLRGGITLTTEYKGDFGGDYLDTSADIRPLALGIMFEKRENGGTRFGLKIHKKFDTPEKVGILLRAIKEVQLIIEKKLYD